ncbi:MAG: alpha/beta fold hydrolase [Halapricum sp.]
MTAVDSRTTTLTPGDADPVSIRYFVAGEGPPAVLVHGIGLDAATVSWKHTIPALAGDRTVYALDLPGHGDSDKPRRRYTTDYFRDVLAAFHNDLGLEGAPLVGASMGGAVALGYALDRGDPSRLALLDSYGLGGDTYWRPAATGALWTPGISQHLWSGVGSSKATVRSSVAGLVGGVPESSLVEDVYRTVQDRDVLRAMRSWQRSEFRPTGLRTDYSDQLGELDAPTLLIHGADDPLLPPAWSRTAHNRLPHSYLHMLSGCGHWPTRERPKRVNRLLASFLGGRGPASD